ncbi:MAG TPA: hypothetical protein VJ437_13090 [Acidiferrobacterales bacterium]|nr:hypothetical protein [Acidiferrobacterales bacterium]
MILKIILALLLVVVFFWIGWRAHLCWWLNSFGSQGLKRHGVRVPFDDDLWIGRLSGPVVALFSWCVFAVYVGARGWL